MTSLDPLSEILRITRAQPAMSRTIIAGGRWGLKFPVTNVIKFSAVAKGSFVIKVDCRKHPVTVEEGDMVLLSGMSGFFMGSSLDAPHADLGKLFATKGPTAQVGKGSDCITVGGIVTLAPSTDNLFRFALPPLAHVRASSPHGAALRWIVDQILVEQRSSLPGAAAVSAQLAQLMFMHILRAHLEVPSALPSGWLRAMSDERIARALEHLHREPARAWRLDELAKIAGMSRTAFAVRFRDLAGEAPLTYLTKWRMNLGQQRLRDEEVSVGELSHSLGYASETAFSTAFKRFTGDAPRDFRRMARQ